MEIKIVAATVDRAESFWRALDYVARERRYLLFTEAPPLEMTRRFVSDLVEKGDSQFYAVSEGIVVGWCDIVRYEKPGMRHCGHLGIGLLPGHRALGLGQRLLQTTIDDAFAKGVERVELEVFASNQRAHRIYAEFGFVEEGHKRRARFLDGQYDDFIVMSLLKEIDKRNPAGSR